MAIKKPEKPKAAKPKSDGKQLRPFHWKKGQSGNPAGRAVLLPEEKLFKNLTKKELIEVGNYVIKGDLTALKSMAARPGATVLQIMLAAVCIKVIQKGDMHQLDILLNRLVGKVRDEIHATGAVDAKVVVSLPSNGREVGKVG